MADEKQKLSGWRKWVVGIGIIIAAIAGYAVAWLDGDDTTKPDTSGTVAQVQQGVETLKGE